MAVVGFFLVSVEMGKEHDVQRSLLAIGEISERYALHYLSEPEMGRQYDFLIVVRGEDSSTLERFIEEKIKKIDGVRDTKALIGMTFTPSDKKIHSSE